MRRNYQNVHLLTIYHKNIICKEFYKQYAELWGFSKFNLNVGQVVVSLHYVFYTLLNLYYQSWIHLDINVSSFATFVLYVSPCQDRRLGVNTGGRHLHWCLGPITQSSISLSILPLGAPSNCTWMTCKCAWKSSRENYIVYPILTWWKHIYRYNLKSAFLFYPTSHKINYTHM